MTGEDGPGLYLKIQDFMLDYAACLDEFRLEEWPNFFLDACTYRVLSRENVDLGLPAPIIYHYSRGMLEDRVTAIRDALTFERVYVRHLISNIRVHARRGDTIAVSSNYLVVQTSEEGRSRIYSVGGYDDDVVLTATGPKFSRRDVLVDTFAIDNLMALPI